MLFADVANSTRLFETLGDVKAKELIVETQRLMVDVVNSSSGTVLDYIGDEIMCRFPDANVAVQTACNIQRTVKNMPPTEDTSMSVRIGMHYGSILADGDRLFGDTINIAARLVDIARAGQIITSEQTVELLSDENRQLTRHFDTVKVKGKSDVISIFDVLWEQEEVTMIVSMRKPVEAKSQTDTILLEYNGKRIAVMENSAGFNMGRDPACDLVINSTLASRKHAQVEFRRGKFILVDQSTNGTYVKTNDGKIVYLRREELPLWGSGTIGLGEPVTGNSTNLIKFYFQ